MWVEARNSKGPKRTKRFCRASMALDSGADVRLVGSLSTVEQRLRILDRNERSDDLYCDDSSYDTAFGLKESFRKVIGHRGIGVLG